MKTPAKRHKAPHTVEGFKGYTMDELRYQRALIALKKEYCKERIVEAAEQVQKLSPFSKEGQKNMGHGLTGIFGKVIGGLNYVDYALVGFSAFNTIRKVRSFFKKR